MATDTRMSPMPNPESGRPVSRRWLAPSVLCASLLLAVGSLGDRVGGRPSGAALAHLACAVFVSGVDPGLLTGRLPVSLEASSRSRSCLAGWPLTVT
jgi:hypothetical protein